MSGVGPVVSDLPVIDADNPMNTYYMQQAELHARRHPHDAYAQRLWQHWAPTMQRIRQMRLAQSAVPSSMPQAPATWPGAEAPTPPITAQHLSPQFGQAAGAQASTGPVAHHGSLEQRLFDSTPYQSCPPSRPRTPTPIRRHREAQASPGSSRRRARTRSRHEERDEDGGYWNQTGMGTRVTP